MLQTVDGLMLRLQRAEPTARGLSAAVEQAVRDGLLEPGDPLPPIRTIARRLGVSPTTVSAAWATLARSGAIRTEGRRGTTIAEPARPGPVRFRRVLDHGTRLRLDLSTGVPDPELLPDLGRVLGAVSGALTPGSYLDEPVLPDLATVLRADWPYRAEQITVVDGAMDALELIARTQLRRGDRVVVEHPCFPPLLDLLEATGVTVVGVPLDDEGLAPDELAAALPATAVVLQPRAHNPTGVSMTARRARAIARLLEGSDTLVVEDDSAGAIAQAEPLSLGRWLPGTTLHVRSYSKSYGPDLRLAALSGPAAALQRIAALRQLGQVWSSRLLQRLLLALLTDGVVQREVEVARERYAARRTAFVTELARHGVAVGGGDGFNAWVPVADETAAVARLAGQGIGVAPGAPFAVLPADPHVRVTVGLLREDVAGVAETIARAGRDALGISV
jgi:DNA-binding transcriptional MocR family regulator